MAKPTLVAAPFLIPFLFFFPGFQKQLLTHPFSLSTHASNLDSAEYKKKIPPFISLILQTQQKRTAPFNLQRLPCRLSSSVIREAFISFFSPSLARTSSLCHNNSIIPVPHVWLPFMRNTEVKLVHVDNSRTRTPSSTINIVASNYELHPQYWL